MMMFEINFILLGIVSVLKAVETQNLCPDGYVAFERFGSNPSICFKVVKERKSWNEAAQYCRKDLAYIVNLEDAQQHKYFNGSAEREDDLAAYLSNNHGLTNFWSGLLIFMGRLSWTGQRLSYASNIGRFSFQGPLAWGDNQPSRAGNCGETLTSRGSGEEQFDWFYDMSMKSCNDSLPFVCMKNPIERNVTRTSYCPDPYLGNIEVPYCIGVPENLMTYDEAEQSCKDHGGNLISNSTDLEGEMAGLTITWYKTQDSSFSSGLSVWVNTKTPGVCFNLHIEGLSKAPCDSKRLAMCKIPPLVQEMNVTIHTDYTDQRALLSQPAYQPTVLSSKFSGQLAENVYPVIFTPKTLIQTTRSNQYLISKSQSLAQPFYFNITFPLISTATAEDTSNGLRKRRQTFTGTTVTPLSPPAFESYVGYYQTALYSLNPPVLLAHSEPVLVRFAEPDVYIYVVTATMATPNMSDPNDGEFLFEFVTETDQLAFNLLQDPAYISSLGEYLPSFLRNPRFDESLRQDYPWTGTIEAYSGEVSHFRNGSVFIRVYVALRGNRELSTYSEQDVRPDLEKILSPRTENIIAFETNTLRVLSTVACPTLTFVNETTQSTHRIPSTRIGHRGYTGSRCFNGEGALAYADCLGSFEMGATWGPIVYNTGCGNPPKLNESSSTPNLKNLSETQTTRRNTFEILNDTVYLTDEDKNLTNADVIYVSEILTNVRDVPSTTEEELVKAFEVTNNILNVDNETVDSAQHISGAANRIIQTIDDILSKANIYPQTSKRIVYPSLAAEIWDQVNGSVIGIELMLTTNDGITNDSLDSIRDESGVILQEVDVAIYLPSAILEGETRLTTQVYFDTSLFTSSSNYKLNSRVVAARLLRNGLDVVSLGDLEVTAIFHIIEPDSNPICAYWDYEINENTGGWATDGCRLTTSNERYICKCNHLTNFAILIDLQADEPISEANILALSIITKVGLILSIIGLGLTLLTFVIFKHLRKGRGQQTLCNLALAMLCSSIIFLVGADRTETYEGCLVVAVLLHYFILVSFMWMLMEGILQYLRFVKVLGTYIPKFMLKTMIPAWGLPLIPVIIVLAIDYDLYRGGKEYCWMEYEAMLYAFIIPIALVMAANLLVFIIVIYNLCRRPKGMQVNQSERKMAFLNFQAALSIFVLLGLTWVFGFMAVDDARIVFHYLFAIFNAFQGFFIFLLFTFREPQVRQSWLKKCCGTSHGKSASSSANTAGQKKKSDISTANTNLSNRDTDTYDNISNSTHNGHSYN